MDRYVCVCICIFPPDSLGHRGGDTFYSELWCWLAHPHAALGLPVGPVPPPVASGSSLTFPAEELRLLLLPYPTAVVSVCGERQTWKPLMLLKCEKDFFAGAAGLQPVAQNGLIIGAAAVLPSSLRGTCSDVRWAHHCFTHPQENLLAKLGTMACFPWVVFSYSKRLDALRLLGMLVWAPQPLAGSARVGGTAVGGDVVGRARQLAEPICLVQR